MAQDEASYVHPACNAGVVGFPNVGKSSLINSLKRGRVAQVGNTPGVTRAVQEVVLDKHLRLLDSPGIVFADPDSLGADAAAHALRNCIKVQQAGVLGCVEIHCYDAKPSFLLLLQCARRKSSSP